MRPEMTDSPIRSSNAPKSYPAILQAAVLSALVFPVAFIPYIAATRHITGLRRTADLLEKNITRLRTDVDVMMARQALTATQLARRHNMGSRSNTFNHWRDQKVQTNQQGFGRVAANGVLQDDLTELKEELNNLRIADARGID